MKKKKNNKIFWIILLILFIIYLSLNIANMTGYYQNTLNERVILTNESIKEFERDISKGKDVTVEDYLKKEKVDYSNKASKMGLSFSKNVEKLMTEGLGDIFKVLGKFFS